MTQPIQEIFAEIERTIGCIDPQYKVVGPRLTRLTAAAPMTSAASLKEVRKRGSHPPGWKPVCACYWEGEA